MNSDAVLPPNVDPLLVLLPWLAAINGTAVSSLATAPRPMPDPPLMAPEHRHPQSITETLNSFSLSSLLWRRRGRREVRVRFEPSRKLPNRIRLPRVTKPPWPLLSSPNLHQIVANLRLIHLTNHESVPATESRRSDTHGIRVFGHGLRLPPWLSASALTRSSGHGRCCCWFLLPLRAPLSRINCRPPRSVEKPHPRTL